MTRSNGAHLRRVAIIDGCRTPFAKAGTHFKHVGPIELGQIATKELINRAELNIDLLDELIFGIVLPPIKATNIAREIGLGIGISPRVPAFTVSRACASANQAITCAADKIASGNADCIIAGGAESLSDIPILLSRRLRDLLVEASKKKSLVDKARVLLKARPRDLVPDAPAIAELSTGLTMGQYAEKMAQENGIPRAAQDEFAYRSHQNAATATKSGLLRPEIAPVRLPPNFEPAITADNGIRADTSLEALAELRPVFDKRFGTVTAGNSSPLTDGAGAVLLMAEDKAKALGYRPLAYIRSYAFAALSPAEQLLMGPAYAAPRALDKAGLKLSDIDLVELHEAFAAQALSNLQAFGSRRFATEKLNRAAPLGEIDPERLNVYGGSIAIGHPFGATGARLTTTLAKELSRRNGQFGLITVCAAGAMGLAMVLERD